MRLDSRQKSALDNALKDIDDEVYLFGSRVDKKRKGGDVDILIFSRQDPYYLSRTISVRILTKNFSQFSRVKKL